MDSDPTFGHWFAGFVAGEGCFTVHVGDHNYCRFRLALRDDDEPILREIQDRLGFGRLDPIKARGTSNPQVAWTVDRKEDCLELVQYLARYSLRARKQRDFMIWKRAVESWNSKASRDELLTFQAQIAEIREYRAT